MKTLLLNPPINVDDSSDYLVLKPPYGLAVISSYLKSKGHDIVLWDAQGHHKTRSEILDYIEEIKPDVVGMGTFTFQLFSVTSLAVDIKKRFPHITIILGGPHVTAVPEGTLRDFNSIDMIVIGEGELVMEQLLNSLINKTPLSEIDGLAFREDQKIIVNSKHQRVQDLDSLPMADWESLPMGVYWDALATKKAYGIIFGSRGCPFSCTFCAAHVTNGKAVRLRSPEKIAEELRFLKDRFDIDEFTFNDSTFTLKDEWVVKVCEEIMKLDFPVKWRCTVRGDCLHKETLKIMKKSGCVKVLMGIESADPHVLKVMKKGETIEDIETGLEKIEEAGLTVDASFIVGMPGDTAKSIRKSVTLAKKIQKNPGNTAALTLATPFPGSDLYDTAVKQGLTSDNWKKMDSFKITYIPEGMSEKELAKIYRKALFRLYFFNISYLFQRVCNLTWHQFKINLRYAVKIFVRGFKSRS